MCMTLPKQFQKFSSQAKGALHENTPDSATVLAKAPDTYNTPNMIRLLIIGVGNSSGCISYYRHMIFLDNQASFNKIFGDKLIMCAPNPGKLYPGDIKEQLGDYVDI